VRSNDLWWCWRGVGTGASTGDMLDEGGHLLLGVAVSGDVATGADGKAGSSTRVGVLFVGDFVAGLETPPLFSVGWYVYDIVSV
jgi:hypothetical protein